MKHYNLLMKKAKNQNGKRNTGVYYEAHHIIPRSEGGGNGEDNLVLLTAREHFLAHWLLYRADSATPSRAHAFWRMCRGRGKVLPKDWLVVPARVYEEARLAHSQAISHALKGRKKSQEHIAKVAAANKGKKREQNAKDKMSEAAKKRGTPEGYYLMKDAAILINRKPVLKLDPTTLAVLTKYSSLKEAAQSVTLHSGNLSVAIKNQTRSGGFRWKFEETI